MSAALLTQLRLTDDQLRVVTSCAGVHDLPVVLTSHPQHATVCRRDAALDRAAAELASCSLIVEGAVHPDVVTLLHALHRPDRELAMRMVTPEGTVRVSAVRRGTLCVLARRITGGISLRNLGHDLELSNVATALAAELPPSRSADIVPVGAPLPDMVETLSSTHDPMDLADAIRALGAESRAALLLGSALASRQAFVEIVYSALDESEDRISRGPAAVAMFYTKRGRIVAAPSSSPAGQLWTTLKAGSDHAFGQAIGQLVELAETGWTTARGKVY